MVVVGDIHNNMKHICGERYQKAELVRLLVLGPEGWGVWAADPGVFSFIFVRTILL